MSRVRAVFFISHHGGAPGLADPQGVVRAADSHRSVSDQPEPSRSHCYYRRLRATGLLRLAVLCNAEVTLPSYCFTVTFILLLLLFLSFIIILIYCRIFYICFIFIYSYCCIVTFKLLFIYIVIYSYCCIVTFIFDS